MGKYEEASLRTLVGVSSQHIDDDVYVHPSKYLLKLGITDKNNGLYANRTFQAGDVIIEYIGKQISLEKSNTKSRAKQYMFEVRKNGKVAFVIDAANNKFSSAAKFANTVIYDNEGQNAEFKQYKQRIYLVALKRIRANTEILTWYGHNTHGVINES